MQHCNSCANQQRLAELKNNILSIATGCPASKAREKRCKKDMFLFHLS
jgi:hypothetical protein